MKIRSKNSNNISIDGKMFSGKCVTIVGNKVTVDGVEQEGELTGDVNITVDGDVYSIENSSGVVKANKANTIKTMSGDVECGDVSGMVKTMSGDITSKSIQGGASSMSGDIRGVN